MIFPQVSTWTLEKDKRKKKQLLVLRPEEKNSVDRKAPNCRTSLLLVWVVKGEQREWVRRNAANLHALRGSLFESFVNLVNSTACHTGKRASVVSFPSNSSASNKKYPNSDTNFQLVKQGGRINVLKSVLMLTILAVGLHCIKGNRRLKIYLQPSGLVGNTSKC